MKISNAFPSKYLRAADLNEQPMLFTMSEVRMEDIGDSDKKPVLHFLRSEKGLVLNKTNSKIIGQLYGDDTDNWEGQPIVLYPAMVDFRGDTVEAIRVRAPKRQAPAVRAVQEAQQTQPAPVRSAAKHQHDEANPPPAELDDEIPF